METHPIPFRRSHTLQGERTDDFLHLHLPLSEWLAPRRSGESIQHACGIEFVSVRTRHRALFLKRREGTLFGFSQALRVYRCLQSAETRIISPQDHVHRDNDEWFPFQTLTQQFSRFQNDLVAVDSVRNIADCDNANLLVRAAREKREDASQ